MGHKTECFRDGFLIIRRYTNQPYFTFYTFIWNDKPVQKPFHTGTDHGSNIDLSSQEIPFETAEQTPPCPEQHTKCASHNLHNSNHNRNNYGLEIIGLKSS